MSPQPTPLGIPSMQDMLTSMLATLTVAPQHGPAELKIQQQAAAEALAALQPGDAVEAELAARIVTAHYAAMDCFRRAALPDVSDHMAIRLRGSAVSLSRMAERLVTALERRATATRCGPDPVSRERHPVPSASRAEAGGRIAEPGSDRQRQPSRPEAQLSRSRGQYPLSSEREATPRAARTPLMPVVGPHSGAESRTLPDLGIPDLGTPDLGIPAPRPATLREELLSSVSMPRSLAAAE